MSELVFQRAGVGSQGATGATGATGPQGATGADSNMVGPTGAAGSNGAQGAQGAIGAQGATGSQGPQGASGSQGAQGSAGSAGATGSQGPQGATGSAGSIGANSALSFAYVYRDYNTALGDDFSNLAVGEMTLAPQTTDENPFSTVGASDTDANGIVTVGGVLSAAAGSKPASVMVTKVGVPSAFVSGQLAASGLNDIGSFWFWGYDGSAQHGSSANPFADGDAVIVALAMSGANGSNGAPGNDGRGLSAVSSAITFDGTNYTVPMFDDSAYPMGAWIVVSDGPGTNILRGQVVDDFSHSGGVIQQGTIVVLPFSQDGVVGDPTLIGTSTVVSVTGGPGLQGATGSQGATGPQGAAGAQGATGAQGAVGAQGATGAQGPQGAVGAQGATGAQGAQGAAGATGAQGVAGPQGATGAQGAQGATGSTGPTGPTGPDWQLVRTITPTEWTTAVTGTGIIDLWTPSIGDTISDIAVIVGEAFNDIAGDSATLGPFGFEIATNEDRFTPAYNWVVGHTSLFSTLGYARLAAKYPAFATTPTHPLNVYGFPVMVVGTPTIIQAECNGSGFSSTTGDVNLFVWAKLSGGAGPTGPQGATGPQGPAGGAQGAQGSQGAAGPTGATGATGSTGATGTYLGMYDPGSLSASTESFLLQYNHLKLSGSERLTLPGTSEVFLSNFTPSVSVGTPKTPCMSFTVQTEYFLDQMLRLTLINAQRATLLGTADLIITDDFATRSRIVLSGSTRVQ